MKKTDSTKTIVFTPVESIVTEEVERAIKPFIAKLRAAAEEDARLEKHRDEANPDIAAEVFDKTYAAAVAGDAAAEKQIYNMGPRESLVERQRQIYNIREAARFAAAVKNVDLFNQAGQAAAPAVKRAGERAQEQHRAVLRAMGEPEADSQLIAQNIGWHCHYLGALGENCRNGDGAVYLLERGGFTKIVLGDNAQ